MRNKWKLLVVALALTSSVYALAETSKDAATPRFGIGPTLGILRSTTGFGASLNLLFKGMQDAPLYVGIESGVVYWSDSGSLGGLSASGSLVSIPILPMALYQFKIPGSNVKPYIGIALGISVTPMSATVSAGGTSASGSTTKVYFEGLLKPGVEVSSFFFEPKLGLLNDQFVFLPTIGYYFDL